MMIRRVLLACRGEIAFRFIRTAQRLCIETIAVYDEEEKTAPFVMAATYRVQSDMINPFASSDYLLTIAKEYKADAIAPGYGPLAENADFAQACTDSGIIFIGPNVSALSLVGNKIQARQLAIFSEVPVIPGSAVASLSEAQELAASIGYPVLLKAVNGGGGRGIRLAESQNMLEQAWKEVERESLAAFGTADLYIERFLGHNIRHIEVQILADVTGNVIALGERGCSIQRRRQKMVEESPVPGINATLRKVISESAVKFARAAGYTSAGTVEFLVDTTGQYYFIEMNGRIQVEHPVTEAVTGIDIVEAMFTIAEGKPLSDDILNIVIHGHAVEFRICAEDPFQGFMPTGGVVTAYNFPHGAGIRIDTGIAENQIQLTRYDSLCLKLIVWGRNRDEAISRAKIALDELVVAGFPTNIPFHRWLVDYAPFSTGNYDLSLISDYHPEPLNETLQHDIAIAVALREYLTMKAISEGSAALSSFSSWRFMNERRVSYGG
ncbi:ATP-grasp domain-containing protein [Xenorhabdus sp. Reich]|uniref:biotin carboxylase n=1 Tax=Xenorhabdus littoralis TaxID=2582835 RepID=A0ABU4SJA8_9GAMM|nr:biotin carboxylase N-terminal domain-containing protein [Xenorhabdus sp. Reich]MDX7998640.1 ATP-grasp domain-containing protein [Xenorhabdus sp. Reich]